MAVSADPLTPRAREIVAAGRVLLERDGPAGLSMRAVAAELGIRAASLYKHLPNKDALETALVAAGLTEIGECFEEAVVGSADPLRSLAVAYRQWALEHPHLYRLSTDRPLERDRLAPGVEERPAAVLVAACGGDEHAARAAFAFAHGMVMLELAGRFPPHADIHAAWRRGIDGLRPPASPPPASAGTRSPDLSPR